MKIVHIFKHAFPDVIGGIEKVIDDLASHQAQIGHNVVVIATSKYIEPGIVKRKGYTIYFCRPNLTIGSTPFSMDMFLNVRKLVLDADIINSHFPYPFSDLCLLLSKTNAKIVVTYHSDIVRQRFLKIVYWPLMQLAFKRVCKIIATSKNYLSTSTFLNKKKQIVNVVPIGIEDKFDANKVDPDSISFKDYFIFVGEFRYYKGLHILIEAASEIDNDILIIGAGAIKDELITKANHLGLKNVHFLGRLDDDEKQKYLQNALAVVFPSHMRSEAFGITLVEGAMNGKPMISCEIGTGTSYINLDQVTGIVCKPRDVKEFTEAMNLLANNKKLIERMGAAARERYLKLFQVENMTSQYMKIYENLISED